MHRCWGAMVQQGKWGNSCIITWTCIWFGWWAWYGWWTWWIYLVDFMILCLDVWNTLDVDALLMLLFCDVLVALGYILC